MSTRSNRALIRRPRAKSAALRNTVATTGIAMQATAGIHWLSTGSFDLIALLIVGMVLVALASFIPKL